MIRQLTALLMLVVGLVSAGSGGSAGQGLVRTEGNPSCITQCRANHNQCRVATKGSPSCDAQLQACLQTCLRK